MAGLCRDVEATHYISGPAAKDYMSIDVFDSFGVEVEWADYSGYPEYPQLWGDFDHFLSILDLLFNAGLGSKKYMKYVK